MRVLVIGRSEALLASARAIVAEGRHDVVAVITARPNAEHSVGQAEFAEFARERDALYRETQTIDEPTIELIRHAGADVGISVNWVTILDGSTIDLVEHGILNAHFGDLPRYRGNAAGNWAILAGEQYAVLTVHRMAPLELDLGEILSQRRAVIGSLTSIGDLVEFANDSLPAMFREALDRLEDGRSEDVRPIRDAGSGFRCYPRLPTDGLIDWRDSAVAIDRLVRASTDPYPGAYTYYRDKDDRLLKLIVWEARVHAESSDDRGVPGQVIRNDRESGESFVLTGNGILALRWASQSGEPGRFGPGTRWRSTRLRLGMNVEDEIYRLLSPEDPRVDLRARRPVEGA
jgi:methionyl-tRNA formyltransferase